jgi:hypothetical protein
MMDLGQQILASVYEKMMIDEEWSLQQADSFIWWGRELAQRAWCSEPVDNDGVILQKLNFRTDLFQGYDGTPSQVGLLNLFARMASTSALVRNEDDPGLIQLATSLSIHKQIEGWVTDLAAWACSLQAAEAYLLAAHSSGLMIEESGLSVAASEHPDTGARSVADDMLDIIQYPVAPAGEQPSAWAGEEMEKVLELLRGPPCVLATGDGNGLCAEFPFGERTSLMRINTREAHPRLGNGCLMTLTLPLPVDDVGKDNNWLGLNSLETGDQPAPHLLGSWCRDDRGPTFVCFLPNVIHLPNDLIHFSMSMARRAQWVSDDVFGLDFVSDFDGALERKMELWLGNSK